MLVAAVLLTVIGKVGATQVAGRVGGFTPRQSFNAGVALVAHGEFTVIIAQLAATNPRLGADVRAELIAFAGLYVLATATVGVILMRESKVLGRRFFRTPRLAVEER